MNRLVGDSEALGVWECDVCGWWGTTPDNPHRCEGPEAKRLFDYYFGPEVLEARPV